MTRADVQFGRDLAGRGNVDYSGRLLLLRQDGYARALLLWLLPVALLGSLILALVVFSVLAVLLLALAGGGAIGLLLCLLYQHFWLRREAQIAISPMSFVIADRMGSTVILHCGHTSWTRWLWFDVRRVADLAVTFADSASADEFVAAFEEQRKRHLLSPALAHPSVRDLPPLPEPEAAEGPRS
jgi:hypothetical protein